MHSSQTANHTTRKMNRPFHSYLLRALYIFTLFIGTLNAQVPNLLNYQGRVVVGTTNFDGTGQFRFALVNPAGTTAYWTNDGTHLDGTQPTAAVALTVTKGLYSAMLGDTTLTNMTAIPASVFANADVRLRVWFNDGANGSQLLTPDQRIAPSAYLADGAVTSAKIAAGAVTNTQLATNAVQAANIATGAVDSTKIANVAIITGNLANGSVTATKLGSDVGLWSASGLNVFRNAGNVGIGTSTPQAALDVFGLTKTTQIELTGGAESGSFITSLERMHIQTGLGRPILLNPFGGLVSVNAAVPGIFTVNGSIGIGTLNPPQQLSLTGGIGFANQNATDKKLYSPVDGLLEWVTHDSAANHGFLITHQGDQRVFLNTLGNSFLNGGNVGIGTTTPGAKLHVAGNLWVTGTTTTAVLEITGGSDVAEPFAVSHPTKPEPGMVMTIDREHPGELCVATSAYARTVAGIISGANGVNPGLTLRQPGTAADGTYPVALSGRVYCWCDAAYGEIQPGDLLTTSDTPGHAMVAADSTRAPGATVGKAMTALESGTGLVLVLVTLQ